MKARRQDVGPLSDHSLPPPRHATSASPELGLSLDAILSPDLHAVDGRVGLGLGGQVAPHHLILVELESSLHMSKSPNELSASPTARPAQNHHKPTCTISQGVRKADATRRSPKCTHTITNPVGGGSRRAGDLSCPLMTFNSRC